MEKISTLLKKKNVNLPKEHILSAVRQLLTAVAGFMLGSIDFAGSLAPFGVCLAGGAPPEYLISASIGAAGGYLVFSSSLDALKYIGAITLICFIKAGLMKYFTEGKRLYFYTGTAFGVLFICSVIIIIADGFSPPGIILALSESAIAGAGACFTYRFFIIISGKRHTACLSPGDTAAFMLGFSVILLATDSFMIAGFSPAKVAAAFMIMLFALYGRESAGTMAGVCAGVTLGLGTAQPHLLLAYPLAGLIGGICCEYGRVSVAVGFIICDTLALILKGDAETSLYAAGEAVAASLAFVFLPEKLLSRAAKYISPLSRDAYAEETREILSFDIKKSAKAVKDISDSVAAVTKLLSGNGIPSSSYIPDRVKEEVCRNCTRYDFCWERTGSITKTALKAAYSSLLKNGRLTADNLPERLSLVCRCTDNLCDSFNYAYCEHEAKIAARNEIFEAKAMAAAQFACISGLLEDTAAGITSAADTDARTASLAKNVFDDFGFTFSSLLVFADRNARTRMEIFCTYIPKIQDYTFLTEKLFLSTGIRFSPPKADEYKDSGTVLSFCEQTVFTAECAVSANTAAGEEFSGDTAEFFDDGKGNFCFVLSDGMGTGTRAALDSVMTSSLMSRLMKAGFSMDSALDAVNCALMVKSTEETLSTLDIFRINLYTGRAEFYKAGAGYSVIRIKDRTAIVEPSSLPLGILQETKFEHSEVTLQKGDTVIIMSDGASVLPQEYFKELLYKYKDADVKKIAEKIVNDALNASVSGKNDDITAGVIRIGKPSEI